MGITRREMFTDEQNEIAEIAKVIGHPARVAILQHITKVDTCICGDLVEEIGLAQPTISQHLKELKRVGLLKGNVEGTSVCYCIDNGEMARISGLISTFFASFRCGCGNDSECC